MCFTLLKKKKKRECHSIFASIIANRSVELSFVLPYMDISEREICLTTLQSHMPILPSLVLNMSANLTYQFQCPCVCTIVPNASSQFTYPPQHVNHVAKKVIPNLSFPFHMYGLLRLWHVVYSSQGFKEAFQLEYAQCPTRLRFVQHFFYSLFYFVVVIF